ncbi:MAG: hypothetical protein AB1898_28085 [Acidobacteriota bacterium]
MADQSDPSIQHISGGGVAAEHVPIPLAPTLVAPTTDGDHNTIKASLVPLACWRANDMRFEFESSFVLPEIQSEIGALKELIDRHTLTDEKGQPKHRPALTVFGHADPVGNDEFNKALSGRRAQAIYGMLIRSVELWEDLYAHPLGNDKWEPKAIRTMQSTLNLPAQDKPSASARKALFKAYMDHVCTVTDENGAPVPDDKGQPVQLELKPKDFVANGADPKGKGDFQGCGEFNPILMFSQKENARFSDPKNKSERDAENASNRRVVIFLFRPGVRINPAAWPCPRAKEGVSACKRRFWSDAAKRRTFQENRREFKDTRDTFACRFYHRLSSNSPCERGLVSFQIRLYDLMGRAISQAPFELKVGLRKPIRGTASDQGTVIAQDLELPNRVLVDWGFPPEKDEKPEFVFHLEMFLTHDNLTKEDEARQKLHNLGYSRTEALASNVAAFQTDHGHLANPPLEANGQLDDKTMDLIRSVYRSCEDDLRNNPPKDSS